MHRELVDRRRWISDRRFLHALNYCMLLPGPEAQQLAIYAGWLLHRVVGGLAAGICFVLPGVALIWGISCVYVLWGNVPWIDAVFYGLKPAVIAIVAAAVIRLGRKALKDWIRWGIAAAAFIGIFFLGIPFPAIVIGSGVFGWLLWRWRPALFGGAESTSHTTDLYAAAPDGYVIDDSAVSEIGRPTMQRTLRTATLWTAVWLAPVVACWAVLGSGHVLTQEGFFFSKASLVTFGGAYAVLPYVAQQAVETHGWLTATQMVDGLGLAETTPGPLVLVLQFVGFLGGWNEPGAASPLLMATLAAGLTSWVIFMPGFLFIFAGAPFAESSRDNRHINVALSAVTAAVVGVILNLAVWFSWHVVYPTPGHPDYFSILAAIAFFVLLQRFKWDVLWVIGTGAVIGVLYRLLV